jgi:MFS family permease
MIKKPSYLTRTVLLLSLVSLFNDVSSEMILPILPLYMAQIGAAPALMGLIEGIAELISAVLKYASGTWSDSATSRKPFVLFGYGISGVGKGLLGLCTGWIGVLFCRIMDRFGKGLRSPARDAMLADSCTPQTRGAVFGFHRSADTLGAIIGPLIALCCIGYAVTFQKIFLISIVPSVLGFVCLLYLRDQRQAKQSGNALGIKNPLRFYAIASQEYKTLLLILGLFAIGNASDLFLVLRLKAAGISDKNCVLFYLLFNVILTLTAYPIGILADKMSKQRLIIIGLLCFATTYVLMALGQSAWVFVLAYCIYGLYYAFTDGVSKALLTNTCAPQHKGEALGLFSMVQSMLYLVAGVVTGLLWKLDGGVSALLLSAALALVCAGLLWWWNNKK